MSLVTLEIFGSKELFIQHNKMRKLLIFLLNKYDEMKNKEILKANNELLSVIAESLNIEVETVTPQTRDSIGGGGIKRPKKQ